MAKLEEQVMSRVVHFEIHASQPEALVEFYSTLFGWNIKKWEGPADYWLIETGPADRPGINGGLMRRVGPPPAEMQPVSSFVCTVEVSSVDESVQKSTSLGGTVALAKMPVPGVGWLAYVKDPDGNIFGMIQPDQNAA
jgi:predicted enzyme related to lactoylglutathione lyase